MPDTSKGSRMAARKRRKKTSIKKTTQRKSPRITKNTFVKPPGIRVEDIKPNTVFRFQLDEFDEIHLALATSYGTREGAPLYTWCLEGKEKSPCADMLPGHVMWDYKIEILGRVDADDIAKKLIRACKKKKES